MTDKAQTDDGAMRKTWTTPRVEALGDISDVRGLDEVSDEGDGTGTMLAGSGS